MKKYIKLIRIKHWIKNGLIFLPLFFGKRIFEFSALCTALGGALAFSLLSSSIYIINDIKDREKDRLHTTKKYRPIASGSVSVKKGICISVCLMCIAILLNYFITRDLSSWGGAKVLLLYLIVNLCYSCFDAKSIAFLDIILLVAGFFLRVLYGAIITGIPISNWLCLTVITASFYMALGKRRNEIKSQEKDTRVVLQKYTYDFLDKNMYMCMAITIIFYSLWCLDFAASKSGDSYVIWTVPIVLIIAMRYSYDVENGCSDGDPVEVILKDKILILLGLVYAFFCFFVVYLG